MKLAIMQPYVFPYIGYIQLLNLVDRFVIYDDVNFIKQGWINRNRIALNDKEFVFTIPLKEASSFKKINEIGLDRSYDSWKKKFAKTLEQSYKRAPNFKAVYGLVTDTLDEPAETISQLAYQSIKNTAAYLQIDTEIIPSSVIYQNNELSGQNRVIDICLRANAGTYINPSGGMDLYSFEDFANKGVTLQFLKAGENVYDRGASQYIKSLSVIDILMYNSVADVKKMLNNYQLIG